MPKASIRLSKTLYDRLKRLQGRIQNKTIRRISFEKILDILLGDLTDDEMEQKVLTVIPSEKNEGEDV